jgi:hypothetical protein
MLVSMALKEMLRIELNAEGSAALDVIIRATGMKRTQVIHSVLAEYANRIIQATPPIHESVRIPSDHPVDTDDKLPQRTPEEILESAQQKIEERRACIHPAANRTSGKQWKCTACGFQK